MAEKKNVLHGPPQTHRKGQKKRCRCSLESGDLYRILRWHPNESLETVCHLVGGEIEKPYIHEQLHL